MPEIRAREEDFISRAIASWSQNPNLMILGNPEGCSFVDRLVRRSIR